MNLCSKTFSVNLVCFPEVSDCSSHFNMLVMNPPLPLKTFSKLQGHQLATRLIHVVWKLQSNSSYYDGGPIFCPGVNCKVEKETRSLRFMPSTQTYRESCKKHSCQALGTASWTVAPQRILWVDSRTFWGWLSQRNRTDFTQQCTHEAMCQKWTKLWEVWGSKRRQWMNLRGRQETLLLHLLKRWTQ